MDEKAIQRNGMVSLLIRWSGSEPSAINGREVRDEGPDHLAAGILKFRIGADREFFGDTGRQLKKIWGGDTGQQLKKNWEVIPVNLKKYGEVVCDSPRCALKYIFSSK